MTHELRAAAEKTDLDEKIFKLGNFLNSVAFRDLSFADKSLLTRQLEVMIEYSGLLGARIARFGDGL